MTRSVSPAFKQYETFDDLASVQRESRKRSALRRVPLKGASDSRWRGTHVPDVERQAVSARSGGRCEANLSGCLGVAHQMHHRKMRSQGGPDLAVNLLDCCQPCHAAIHAHPADSYERGLLIRRDDLILPLH